MKIKFYNPTNKDEILTFTTDNYGYDAIKDVYFFIDKFNVKQEFAKNLFIGTENQVTK